MFRRPLSFTTVDGRNHQQPPGMIIKPVVNSGISTTLTSTGLLARFFSKDYPQYHYITYSIFFGWDFWIHHQFNWSGPPKLPIYPGGLPTPSTKTQIPRAIGKPSASSSRAWRWRDRSRDRQLVRVVAQGFWRRMPVPGWNKQKTSVSHGLLIMVEIISCLWLKPWVAYGWDHQLLIGFTSVAYGFTWVFYACLLSLLSLKLLGRRYLVI